MQYEEGRRFLKSEWSRSVPFTDTDEQKGVPAPPFEKEFRREELIALPDPKEAAIKSRDIVEILAARQSRRKLGAGDISIGDLSFLLWAVQGMREIRRGRIFRTVPSGGARHPFDTYFYADRVIGLRSGLYRYIATENAVLPVSYDEGLKEGLNGALMNQWFGCAVALFWVCVPYRCEWRYVRHSHKLCALDAGHSAQNGYLAAEALGIGCCVIGAYEQETADRLLGLDGQDEFVCYAAVFGPYA